MSNSFQFTNTDFDFVVSLKPKTDRGDSRRLRTLSWVATDVFLIFFDVASRKSFDRAFDDHLVEVRQFTGAKGVHQLKPGKLAPVICMVATKIDLRDDKEAVELLAERGETMVTSEEIAARCAEEQLPFCEVSALADKWSIKNLFDTVLRTFWTRHDALQAKKAANKWTTKLFRFLRGGDANKSET